MSSEQKGQDETTLGVSVLGICKASAVSTEPLQPAPFERPMPMVGAELKRHDSRSPWSLIDRYVLKFHS